MSRIGSEEIAILREMVGLELLSVEYEASGDVESAYLRFRDGFVELAAILCPEALSDAFPWRLAPRLCDLHAAPTDLAPRILDLGRVASVHLHEDGSKARVECLLAIELEGRPALWVWAAGGDFVQTSLSGPPDYATDYPLARTVQ